VRAYRAFALLGIALSTSLACGGRAGSSGFAGNNGGSSSGGPGGSGGGHGSSSGGGGDLDGGAASDAPSLFADGWTAAPEAAAPPPASVPVVYAHSADTLYRLDPTSDQVTVVGPFQGCTQVIDIALDQNSNAYVTTFDGLYKADLTSAACTLIASGNYPNSLSFVPKGTVDPSAEALVGYQGSQYVRIDVTTGAITNIGVGLSNGYTSSGDIVSVAGGGTFLTVKGGPEGCSDCLLQVDPTTGALIKSYGLVNHTDVFGLAFWAGKAYGFDNLGEVFSIGYSGGTLVTTDIPVPNPPAGLSFWGAGSTTAAPPTSADGGGIPIVE
jgi:hypothetical protein